MGADERQLRRRLLAVTAIFAGGIAVLGVCLFVLQIVRGRVYVARAQEVRSREATIPAQRGEILDRTATVPLVFNVDSFAVDLAPAEVPEAQLGGQDGLLARLARVLSLPLAEVEKRVPEKTWDQYQPIEIKGGVPLATVSWIAERLDQFPGVTTRNKPIRNYLETGSLAHVIGYVGSITREELQVMYNRSYGADAVIGKSGVEQQYEELLRGTDGKRFASVDAHERRIGQDEMVVPPVPGKDLVLTIDNRIQKIAEQALGERRGSVVVLQPATGEVLAMVSWPSFDPNRFYDIDSSDYLARLFGDTVSSPFLNRAVQSVYPPGSTFKTVLTTAAIEERSIPLTKGVRCTGVIHYGDRDYHCWQLTGHGYLDLFGGLGQSCDVYFYNLAMEETGLGVERIDTYGREFGFGQPTGIDLPEENPGLLPSPEWKQKVRHLPWTGGDTLNLAIGQGDVQVSLLQLADMMAMVANGGTIYRPHLLKAVRDPTTGTLEAVKPEVLRSSHVSKDTWALVQAALRGTIVSGTAQPVITTQAVEVAGKTGTAETGVKGKLWHSWFVAWAPYQTDKPEDQVVVAVMVEASDAWEWWAPKAANLIIHSIFTGESFEQTLATLRPWYAEAAGRRE